MEGIHFSGGKAMARCADCGKIVTINKRIFGSMHLCISDEMRAERDAAIAAQRRIGNDDKLASMIKSLGL